MIFHSIPLFSSTSPTDSTALALDIVSFPENRLIERYQGFLGALVGASLAALVALYSIWRTNKNNLALEQNRRLDVARRQEDIYCGLLHEIAGELDAHAMIFRDLVRDLPLLRNNSLAVGKVIVSCPPARPSLSHIDVCRIKILEYDGFDTRLLHRISAYVNVCAYFNTNLDFTPLIQVQHQMNINQEEIMRAIKDTFQALEDHLATLQMERENLREAIVREVERFPGNVIVAEGEEI